MDDLSQLPPVALTVEYLTQTLLERGLLTDEQAARLRRDESTVRARLLRQKIEGLERRRASRHTVGAPEIVASFEFVTPSGQKLDEDRVMEVIADEAGLDFLKPDPLELDMELITGQFSRPFARRHSILPVRREDGRTIYALADPFDRALIQQLRDVTPGGEIGLVVSPKTDIQRIIGEFYGFRSSISAAEQEFGQGLDINNLEQLVELKGVDELEATDRPVVNAVEYLLHYAFDQRASDIHIEPKRSRTVVRLRIDGLLHNIYSFPKAVHAAFVSRLKMLARMDIAEKRRPQDGRIKTHRAGREVELRVSSLPVAFGEKMVIRVFDPQALIQELDAIGFFPDDLKTWRKFIARPHGLVLVTGPTGSGKTTTLYSTLKELAGPDINITTVEDPIEMVYEEFNQVLVQRRIDVTFASALRTILRQDPDVVMVGEIRDEETARMAVQAAMTGHLVFSTLHTNDTASSITRLVDLGVEPFLLSSTLVGVMAQRLVRKICDHCRVEARLSSEQLQLLDITLPPRSNKALPVGYGEGCAQCRGTGYFGRSGIFELLEIDDTVRSLVSQNASAPAIRKLARKVTTFEEVVGVIAE
jgi:general secretion pathway protein E